MSSIKSAQEANAPTRPLPRAGDAASPTPSESGGAPATEEDIGTEGAGTEPPADEAPEVRRSPPSK